MRTGVLAKVGFSQLRAPGEAIRRLRRRALLEGSVVTGRAAGEMRARMNNCRSAAAEAIRVCQREMSPPHLMLPSASVTTPAASSADSPTRPGESDWVIACSCIPPWLPASGAVLSAACLLSLGGVADSPDVCC